MNRTSKLLLLFCCLAILAGCNKVTYKKTAGGMPYQVFPSNSGQRVYAGSWIKLGFTQEIKDSVYFSTAGHPPLYLPVTTETRPYELSELWTSLYKGDSVVVTQMMDTFINRDPRNVRPEFKKGDRIVTYIKVLDILPNDSAYRIDNEKVQKEYLQQEIAYIEKYLADKKISAVKTPSGAFVEIINPGTGNPVDSGNYVTVNYTGTTFSGKKFDSNTDTSFHHAEPYPFVAGAGQMIKGFDEAVLLLKKGAVAKVYVPSILGYGGNTRQGSVIKPYDMLIFDLEIVDVKDKAPAPTGPPANWPQQKPGVKQQ